MEIVPVMPFLRSGAGGSPKNGGCLIEVAGYLWDGRWTDKHDCVHPVLREMGIRVNDSVSDSERQRLLVEVVPRIVGTAIEDETLNKRVSVHLALFCARKVSHLNTDPRVQKALDAAQGWLNGTTSTEKCRANAAAAYASNAAESLLTVDFLIELLDEYDSVSGRTDSFEVDQDSWRKVCEVMSSR